MNVFENIKIGKIQERKSARKFVVVVVLQHWGASYFPLDDTSGRAFDGFQYVTMFGCWPTMTDRFFCDSRPDATFLFF